MRKNVLGLTLILWGANVYAFDMDKSIHCPKDVSVCETSFYGEDSLILYLYNREKVLFRSEPVKTPFFDDILPEEFTGKYRYNAVEKKLSCEYLTWNGKKIVVYNIGFY
jgi:hypothetical protein